MKKMKWIKMMIPMGLALALAGCGPKAKETEQETSQETQAAETVDTIQETETENASGETEESQAEAAPDFEAKLLSGDTVKLSDYQGKKVLLNFWASWCGPCVREMPAFEKLTGEYPEDLVILGVNCGEDEKTVQQFIDKNGYTFPIAMDTDYEIQSLYPDVQQGIPYTVLLDEEGNIVHTRTGAADADTMYAAYKEELGLE